MPLVETRALTAEMSPTESTTTISFAGGAGSPWAYSIHHLPEKPPRGGFVLVAYPPGALCITCNGYG